MKLKWMKTLNTKKVKEKVQQWRKPVVSNHNVRKQNREKINRRKLFFRQQASSFLCVLKGEKAKAKDHERGGMLLSVNKSLIKAKGAVNQHPSLAHFPLATSQSLHLQLHKLF